MDVREDRETSQARDVAILDATRPDGPVRVDTAMRRRRLEYAGPSETGGDGWWRRVVLLAARH